RTIAYFSMEIALERDLPTYSGGLGVLAGDTIRAAADMGVPLVGVSLIHRTGYFRQHLDASGNQKEEAQSWAPEEQLSALPQRTSVTIEGRTVQVRAWGYVVRGLDGFEAPVYLLDTDIPENSDWDRSITDHLYGGDEHYRLCQEVVLGIGGVRILRKLGYDQLRRFHMNEGHSSLLTLELLDEQAARSGRTHVTHEDIEPVRKLCVFTTHTPVPAGHDQFPMDLVNRVLGRRDVYEMKDVFCCEGALNLTYLALNLSHYVNGVAKRHGLVSQHMFGGYVIDSITNGVHAASWTGPAFEKLFDRRIPGWRKDNDSLRSALGIPADEVWAAHLEQKQQLLERIREQTGAEMKLDRLTIGFARRMTAYKRPDLLFRDLDRLTGIAAQAGGLQIVYAGKAHPRDQAGKELIRRVFRARDGLSGLVQIAFLEGYDLELGKLITGGVDVWLNTPEPPLEASGTSGMKAALNGVPSLSIPDGWWLEGCVEGVTGWSIGEDARDPARRQDGARDAASLYEKLETAVVPAFREERERFVGIMRHAIALNGAFFNTQRMLGQYVLKAYFA
ncbi:MAG: alpha-glucan family phosphorylase, partial [Planctomycetaceae bacterium]|nr:alpha-glucan family phosphorylase [Planctomycetaceae bacterium]